MGWQVIGFGSIEVEAKYTQEILDLMIGDKRKVVNKLYGNDKIDDFEEIEGKDGYISFKMSGNKIIDYRRLEEIKAYCKARNIYININVGEYTEGDCGYYYNSEDNEEADEEDEEDE